MDLFVLTGMSGAGKTHAANTLEDLGFYCVDNMPAAMLLEFVNLYSRIPNRSKQVAFVIDVRGEEEFDTLINEMYIIKEQKHNLKTIFLDCADESIITRYKETRRIHPLTAMRGTSIREAIAKERELLSKAKEQAEYIIDTSKMTIYQLKERITAIVTGSVTSGLTVSCMSFGFKYGSPSEADLVFDVRCFPNPFYIEGLKEKTGLDQDVVDYVLSHVETTGFIEKLYDMVDYLLPLMVAEKRAQIIIAIGCTGGKHRSVCISELLKAHVQQKGYKSSVLHRDILKK